MELKGKKLVFLGDSITAGAGTSGQEHIYWSVIGQKTGAEVFADGIGGTRIARQQTPTAERPWEDKYFASRVDNLPEEADVVVVFGGTNDFGHGDAAFGHMTDRTPDTFYGACHDLLQKLINKYPAAQLVMMTPLHRVSEDETEYNEFGIRRSGDLKRYVDAIAEVAAFYGVAVVDLYRTSGMQPRVESLRQRYMPDGLHPNDAGQLLIVRRLLGLLNAL